MPWLQGTDSCNCLYRESGAGFIAQQLLDRLVQDPPLLGVIGMQALKRQWWLIYKRDSVLCTPCTIRITQRSSLISDQAPDNGDCLEYIFSCLSVYRCLNIMNIPTLWHRGLFLTGSLLREMVRALATAFLDTHEEGSGLESVSWVALEPRPYGSGSWLECPT